MINLIDESILVTGAAGQIGSAVAQKAFDAGATVILNDISVQRLMKVSERLSAIDSSRVYLVEGDITTSEGIGLVIDRAIDMARSISGAVHCAYPRSPGWGCYFDELQPDNLIYSF